LVGLGIIPVLESFARFAWKGLGTPAPIAPTKHLVVSGFYRYVRNPMYVGVVSAILGQALLFGDVRLLAYAAAVWLATFLFVVVYEEPALRRQFGEEYANFRKHVPRWIPRLRPWKG
jgi:protein-S-isoprenylcysteine O-methyltransferase Ste14